VKNAQLLIVFFSLFSLAGLKAQQSEMFQKRGTTLIFINEDSNLDENVKQGLVSTFFKVYPEMTNDFNFKVPDTIEVKIDTSYTGVAYASSNKITISSQWLKNKPNDLDVITHEAMHIVQSYPPGSGPGWLTEGIADYVRYKYGVDNESAQWSLPDYSAGQSYTNSYRITARFLAWITNNYDQDFVKVLDRNLRENTYSQDLWKKYTGQNLDELWKVYANNPGSI
jgi:hypothetical protein